MYTLCEIVINFMRLITLRELTQIFPIEKTYTGEKQGVKDYFYTMNELSKCNIDAPIGENIDDILWEYSNNMLFCFQKKYMHSIGGLRRAETGMGILESFVKDNGIKYCSMYTDSTSGKKYIYDNETGRSKRIKTPIPRYLKVIQ